MTRIPVLLIRDQKCNVHLKSSPVVAIGLSERLGHLLRLEHIAERLGYIADRLGYISERLGYIAEKLGYIAERLGNIAEWPRDLAQSLGHMLKLHHITERLGHAYVLRLGYIARSSKEAGSRRRELRYANTYLPSINLKLFVHVCMYLMNLTLISLSQSNNLTFPFFFLTA